MTDETDFKSRLGELQASLETKMAAMDAVTKAFTIEDNGGVVVSAEQRDDFRKNLGEAQEIKGLIADLQGYNDIKAFQDAPANPSLALAAGAAEAGFYPQQVERKSLGAQFTESAEFKDLLAGGGYTMRQAWEVETKDVFTTAGGTMTTLGFGSVERVPLVPREFRRMRVRDLFPSASTNSNLIDFFRVLGFAGSRLDLSSCARSVGERDGTAFALKPQSRLTFESAQAPVRTIAHWEAAHRNVLQDEPQLQSVINNELLYGLRLEEDRQILNGAGTGEELLGILNTPDIQEYDQAGGETKVDALRRSATLAILANYEPTGYVIHPYDWEDVELTKATGGNEQYVVVTNVAVGAEQRIWRQPVVDSPAIPEGTFLTGAFGLGAKLYDRAQASIRIAEQHEDFFVRNAVVILAEIRLALACSRPESFVKGTFV